MGRTTHSGSRPPRVAALCSQAPGASAACPLQRRSPARCIETSSPIVDPVQSLEAAVQQPPTRPPATKAAQTQQAVPRSRHRSGRHRHAPAAPPASSASKPRPRPPVPRAATPGGRPLPAGRSRRRHACRLWHRMQGRRHVGQTARTLRRPVSTRRAHRPRAPAVGAATSVRAAGAPC